MFNLVERRLATFQRHHAEEFLKEHNFFCGQRPLRQSHVDYLASKMREGLFLQTDVAFARLPDGRSAIIDGQHGLNACRQSGIPINVAVCGYEVKDEAEIWALYAETDQGLRRTQADVVRASRNIMPPEVRDIPHGKVSLYGAAILMAPSSGWAGSYASREIKPKQRVMAVFSSAAEALFLHEYQHAEIFNRIPVRMAMVATRRVDADRARVFWNGVADIAHLPVDDPRRALHRYLAEASGASSAVRVRAVYAHCIGCWNSHVTGKALDDCLREAMQRGCQALKPTIPVPVLATVKLPPRPAYPVARANTPAPAAVAPNATETPAADALPASATA